MSSGTQSLGGIRDVEPRELDQWLREGTALLVDVRESDEHLRERIEGSRLMPLSGFEPAELGRHDPRRVVLHCRSGQRSTQAAQALRSAGWPEVWQLKGGIQGWKKAGLAVRTRRAPISIMRQVQITAGSLVLIFTILGAAVSPWFLVMSGLMGAGLIFAGLSGTCGMASVLSLMPWNRVFRGG